MIYNINDSYHINEAIDQWLQNEDAVYFSPEDEEKNYTEERCMTDD